MNRSLAVLLALCTIAGATEVSRSAISVQERGDGDPVVFLPGLGCRGEVWDGVVDRLPGHRAVLVSYAGFGGVPGQQSSFSAVRDAVGQLVRERRWRNVTLVAHSFSGSLAISLAASSPDLFARVVILDAYPFPAALIKPGVTADAARTMAAGLRQVMAGLTDEQYRAQQEQALHMMITADADYQKVLGWMLASDRQTVAEAQYEAFAADLRPAVHQITQPLLVLGSWRGREALGLSHASVEAALRDQYSGAAHCRIEVSDTARHFLMLDDPAWVAGQIASFVRE